MKLSDTKVQPAEPGDAEKALEWANNIAEQNLFDPEEWLYPCSVLLKVENGEPLLFASAQIAVVMGSLAPKPDLTPSEAAVAMKELVKAVSLLALQTGLREVYFFSADSNVNALAQRHGFERIDQPMYRLKLLAPKVKDETVQ